MLSSIKFSELGPVINVTFAPNLEAVFASAKPIFPVEKFPINLTASIDS